MSLTFIFLNLVFAGSLARSGLPVIATIFDFHVWELSTLMIPIILFVATVLFDADREPKNSSVFKSVVNCVILSLALIMALMYPLIMLVKDTPRHSVIKARVIPNIYDFDATQESRGLEKIKKYFVK